MSLSKEINQGSQDNCSSDFLASIESYLQQYVAPVAFDIDRSPTALKQALQGLIERSLLSVRIPQALGGLGLEPESFYLLQQLLSQYSGALAFLQVQHQGAVNALIKSENNTLKKQYLSKIVQENLVCGAGYSQLRRVGKPLLTAIPIQGGYSISGDVPWITGFNFFDVFILGASLPDGKEITGIIPFKPSSQVNFSEPMKLGAMQSTNTVTATFENYFLPIENVVSIGKVGAIHENDKNGVLYSSFLVLGCAKAGLDIIKKVAEIKELDFIQSAYGHLHEEWQICQHKIKQGMHLDNRCFEDDLELRVWSINLAQRCSKAAVTVSSGAANYDNHPAQRVYKEALVFTVFQQTTDIMKATLEQLMYN